MFQTVYLILAKLFDLDGEEDEDLEFGEAVLLPVAEWAATKSPSLDYEFLFFIAVEVIYYSIPPAYH